MACLELLDKLSLLDSSDPTPVSSLLQQSPIQEKIFAAKIDGVLTDFVITEFINRILVVITQRQTFSTLLTVSKDTPKSQENLDDIYTVRSIFGADSDQSGNLVARFICEHTCMNKPALFALGLQNHSPRTVRAFRDIINQHKSW